MDPGKQGELTLVSFQQEKQNGKVVVNGIQDDIQINLLEHSYIIHTYKSYVIPVKTYTSNNI